MTSSADGDSDVMGLGILECGGNVYLGTSLDEERWAHAIVVHVAGSGILVFEFTILWPRACCDLDALYVCNMKRHGRGVLCGIACCERGLYVIEPTSTCMTWCNPLTSTRFGIMIYPEAANRS